MKTADIIKIVESNEDRNAVISLFEEIKYITRGNLDADTLLKIILLLSLRNGLSPKMIRDEITGIL